MQCTLPQGVQSAFPSCQADWTTLIDGTLYLLAPVDSATQPTDTSVDMLQRIDPDTGHLLSAHRLAFGSKAVDDVDESDGSLFIRLGIPKTANGLPYADYLLVAYRLSDGSLAWSHAMPPFPPPTSANVEPNTSQLALAP